MRIVFLPSDWDAPGSYRCLFPARQLAKRHQVVLPPTTTVEGTDRSIINFDLGFNPVRPHGDIYVLQQRKERMWAEFGVPLLRDAGIISIADVDDNYLELPAYNPAFIGTHPYRRSSGEIINRQERRNMRFRGVTTLQDVRDVPRAAASQPNKSNIVHMHNHFKMVDALTVSTPYLKKLYSKFNSNVKVLRNYLDWDIWDDITPQYEIKRDRLRIGYLGVFRFRQNDLDVIRNVIPKFLHKHPKVDFVANSEEVHDYLSVPPGQRVTIGEYNFWTEGEKYPLGEMTAVCDIGLVPLEMNGLNQAKSHLKGMEYNAAGIPFIATPTESYKDYWCETGINGFLAAGEKDWMTYLELLVSEDGSRRLMGKLSRDKAKQNTIQDHWVEWENFYLDQMGDEYTKIARGAIKHGAVQKVSELSGLLRLIRSKLGPTVKTVVEVGSARGGTFWALSQIAQDDALMVSIDIPSGSPLDVRQGKDVYNGRDRDRFRSYVSPTQTCELIDGNSQEAETLEALSRLLGRRQIDVLFIDADHRYPGVKRDYELYSQLVAPGGIIAFHDVIPQFDKRSGVHLLWRDLKKKYDHYEFIGDDDWGLGKWGAIGVLVNE